MLLIPINKEVKIHLPQSLFERTVTNNFSIELRTRILARDLNTP